MPYTVEAVYENGVLKLIGTPVTDLREGEHVRLRIERRDEKNEDILSLARSVYEGLNKEEVEEIALDRTRFFDEGKS